jgi:hypothetical protein
MGVPRRRFRGLRVPALGRPTQLVQEHSALLAVSAQGLDDHVPCRGTPPARRDVEFAGRTGTLAASRDGEIAGRTGTAP